MILTIVEFVIGLGVLIFLHELGHFLTCRLFKIEVEEFGFGFPPRLVRLFTLSGTEFTLNWIPFGAFVRPKGENDNAIEGGLASANPWKRFVVLLGGPAMNLLTGILLYSFLFTQTGSPDTSIVKILEVGANSPAATAGLKANDVILQVNETRIESTQQLSDIIQKNLGNEVVIKLQREGRMIEVHATPRKNPPPNQGALGIVMGNPIVPVTWFQAIPLAGRMTYEQAAQLVLLPANLIKGSIAPEEARMVGPVGMFDIYSQLRDRDIETETSQSSSPINRIWLLATISIALGLTNLLPIPALDGGRILFLLPELIVRKRVPQQFENWVNLLGFAALILLMVYITTQDISNRIILP